MQTFVCGRPFTIESDHKPLESIFKKSLADTPAQMQCMFLHLQGYGYFLCYHPSKEMTPQIHSHISSSNLALRLHWILPSCSACSTMPICPLSERMPSNWLLRWMLRCMPWLISSSLTGLMISRKSHNHYVPTSNTVNHSLLKMDLCSVDISTLDGVDYLILPDFYSKVFLLCNLPAGQSNSAKVIHILEEWFCNHGTTKVLCTDNGPQHVSTAFADCSIEWGFTHETSSPYYLQSNGFAESCVKIVKHTLQCAKYNCTNPRIALQYLKATPVEAKLPSPSQMLFSYKVCTNIPFRICNTGPAALQVQEHLEDHAEHTMSYAHRCSKQLVPSMLVSPLPHLAP